VVGLDPGLVSKNETALRQQLETVSLARGQANNAARIAREAAESRTRLAAIHALAGGHRAEGQFELMQLFDALPQSDSQEQERAQVLGGLQPRDLNEPTTTWLASQLARTDIEPTLQEQMLSNIVVAALVSVPEPSARWGALQRLVPVRWHDRLATLYAVLARPNPQP
jgi:hypothetical protein